MQFLIKSTSYLLVILLAGLWLKPHASFDHNPAELPLLKPFHNETKPPIGQPTVTKFASGQYQLNYSITLDSISPRELHWFFKNQAHHFAMANNQKWQWFQLTHPGEHSQLVIIDSPDQTSDQLIPGTIFEIQEVIQEQKWKMRLRVGSFGEQGMQFDVMHSGYKVGELNYQFYPTPSGTKIDFNGWLGLDIPIIGDISNFYLFKKVMPEHLLDGWVLHNLETYQHMETLIPILYRQRNNKQFSIS